MEEEEKYESGNKIMVALLFFVIANILIGVFALAVLYYAEQDEVKKTLELVEQKNKEIELVTVVDETFFSIPNEYLEYSNGIKIPLPNNIIGSNNIVSCKKGFESNEIADNSYVVIIDYGVGLLMDIFGDRLNEEYNYEKIFNYNDPTGNKIYVRKENGGYFSYIIYNGKIGKFGVSYGEPKLKDY